MKKDVREVIQGEEPHLNNLLTQEDLSSFKGMVDELRDTWTKKQMFRTETEARFSVLFSSSPLALILSKDCS